VIRKLKAAQVPASKRDDQDQHEDRLEPGLVPADTLEFIDARHPLLEETLRATGATVVPVSFKLDADHPTMVISVPMQAAKLSCSKQPTAVADGASVCRYPRNKLAFRYQSILADIATTNRWRPPLDVTSHVANIGSMIESSNTGAGAAG